jgi:hypothetical protein
MASSDIVTFDTGAVARESSKDVTGAQNALELARLFEVDSKEMYQAAATEIKLVKSAYKALDEKRKAITKPLDAAKSAAMDLFRPALEALEQAEGVYKQSMLAYDRKIEAARKAAEEAARKAADAERERLRQEAAVRAEAERKQREAAAKAEAEAAAAKNAVERARLQAEAEKRRQEAEAERQAAQEAEAQAEMVQAPIIIAPKMEAAGVSKKVTWSAEVTDKMALIKAVAAGLVPESVLLVDMKILNKLAVSLHEQFNYPGVKAVATTGMAIRS